LCVGGRALIHPKGAQKPKMLVVAMSPSLSEATDNAAFSGRAGAVTKELLADAGVALADVRFSYIVRCWSGKADGPRHFKDMPPPPVSITQCAPYLDAEIGDAAPAVIVLLGQDTANAFFGDERTLKEYRSSALTTLRGGRETPVVVTASAQAAANKGSIRSQVVEDLQLARSVYAQAPAAAVSAEYKLVNTAPELTALVDDLLEQWMRGRLEHGAIAVDLETMGLYPFDPRRNIVSIQVAWATGRAALIPLYHDTTNTDTRIEWATHVRDYKWLYTKLGIRTKTMVFDTMLAGHALTGDKATISLALMTAKYLKWPAYKSEMENYIEVMQSAPIDLLVRYGCRDVDGTLQLYPIIKAALERVSRLTMFKRLYMRAWRTLAHMEIDGAQIDPERMKGLAPQYREIIAEARKQLRSLPEHATWSARNRKLNKKRICRGKVREEQPEWLYPDLNPNAPLQVSDFLYGELKCSPIDSKGEPNPTTGEDRLIELATAAYHANPTSSIYVAAQAILRARHAQTKLSRYVTKLVDEIQNPAIESVWPTRRFEPRIRPWLVHANFNLFATATGRLSSSDPNMQNIPRASLIRAAFLSRFRFGTIFKADYSQMELRVLAALAQDADLMAILSGGDARFAGFGGDIHLYTASNILRKDPKLVTKEERHRAKAVSFGIIYGRGARAIAAEYGISEAEAQQMIENYFELFPGVAAFVQRAHKTVKKHGYVVGPMGRYYPIPDGLLSSLTKLSSFQKRSLGEARRQSVNYPIQGSASDIGISSLVDIRRKLSTGPYKTRPFAFVHDSIECDLNTPELFSVYQIMRDVMLGDRGPGFEWMAGVKLKAEFEWGADWQGMMVAEFDGRDISLAGNKDHYLRLRERVVPFFDIEHEEIKSEGLKSDRTKSGPALKTEDIEDAPDYEKVKVKLRIKEKSEILCG
jgi:DNA polymerase-1